MSGLRTCLVCLALLPTLAQAAESNLAETFASCTGRYSAALEHSWLVRDGQADKLATQRETFLTLLQASSSANEATRILNLRIEAKAAHARLLQTGTFNAPSPDQRWALHRAAGQLRACEGLLLKS